MFTLSSLSLTVKVATTVPTGLVSSVAEKAVRLKTVSSSLLIVLGVILTLFTPSLISTSLEVLVLEI